MRIATLTGIPVRLHWSFLGLVGAYGLMTLVTSGLAGLVETASVLGVLFASVVLHELGHAVAARVFGIRTAHITLYPFGGIAAMERMPTSPVQEGVIALAGPAVNGLLALGFGAAWAVVGGWWLAVFAGLNLVMGLFNLIPAFPMDGGRVFRAALTPSLGWRRASRLAITVGRVFAVLFLVGALAFGQVSLALVGAFLLYATWSEARNVDRVEALRAWEQLRAARERARQTASRWTGWDGTGPYRPRWRLDPPS